MRNLNTDIRRTPNRVCTRGIAAGIAAFLIASVSVSCTWIARHDVASHAPRDPGTPWTPPASVLRAAAADTLKKAPALPRELAETKDNWSLEDIIDLTLRTNPTTRASWAAARAAAANMGSKRGAYFPQIEGGANYQKTKNSFSRQLSSEQTTYAPSLALHFILFDFGKRRADVEEARQALYRANWTHNATIQRVVLDVERAYYTYLYAKSAREAQSAAVNEAEANLDAAEERHKAGLATVADVLQARSNYSQKKLALQTVEGQIQTIRGSLATAMGLPPNIPYDIGVLPEALPVNDVSQAVDELIREAETQRPDLAAARADALSAKAHARSVKAEGRPTISLDGNVSRRYYDSRDNYSNNYLQGIFLSWPLFTGFSHSYDVVEAQSNAELAQQQYEVLKGQVDLDVWTSYYDLKTAGERLTTSREFLASATESHDVALGRYKAGVGSILELLSAQTVLEDARAQDLQARADWLLAIAELAYATGRLDVSPSPDSTRSSTQKDGR
jgi:outer membrane protein TolC